MYAHTHNFIYLFIYLFFYPIVHTFSFFFFSFFFFNSGTAQFVLDSGDIGSKVFSFLFLFSFFFFSFSLISPFPSSLPLSGPPPTQTSHPTKPLSSFNSMGRDKSKRERRKERRRRRTRSSISIYSSSCF